MLSILLLCGTVALSAAELEGDGTQKRFVYVPPAVSVAQPPLLFPAPRPVDIGPVELDYPVKMVQKFTDPDGNVQVVTSYSNRKDSDQPIYKSHPTPLAYRSLPYVAPPNARTSAVEVEARSVPQKHQMSRTQTIRFPDANGERVDHEEKTHFRDGSAKSFRTESSFDNSYKKPTRTVSNRSPPPPVHDGTYPSQANYDDEDYSGEPEVEDEVAVRSALKQVNKKEVIVPSVRSEKTPRRESVSGSFRSAKSSAAKQSSEDGPIRSAKKTDHPLESAGSAYVADIEEADSDEEIYDKSDGYDEGHSDIGVHSHGGLGHHGHHHHHGYGHGHGHGINKKFKKGGGQGYHHGEHYAKGEKGGKGHKSKESYDKGHVEKHGHEENKGGKKIEEGEKKGHVDEHNSYHKGHSHHKGEKGNEKAHTKGHKKGKKTKGFRTVHHKDEYKKDEVFYDEEHDAGHEKHHGHQEGGHHEAKGGESKKGHIDSGYKDAHKGVKGQKEEGHSYKHAKGHDEHKGHKGHEGHKEGFHKGEGHKGEEAHGHVHESKGKGF